MDKRITLILLTIVALSSCIDEYEISDEQLLNSGLNSLYIDGRILVGAMSYVYIEEPISLNSPDVAKFVENATVTLIGDNGYDSGTITYDKDSYRYDIDTYDIDPNAKYKIIVNHNGNTYESEYLVSNPAPEIKNLYYTQDQLSNSLIFYVDADGTDSSHNFMWTYDEDFEVHATVNMLYTMHDTGYILRYDPEAFPELDKENGYNPYMYCWSHQNSTEIDVYSTANLTENVVKMHEVTRINVSSSRFNHLYCMTLYQSVISDEAYSYYSTMKKLVELTGSLFSPMPSDVKGNIHCTKGSGSDPRGYITASQVSYKRLFVDNKDIKLKRTIERDYMPGSLFKLDNPDPRFGWGYVLWGPKLTDNKENQLRLYYPWACNCQKVSTKIKPDWWPNDLE